jgi:putative restriction endonuclease
LSIADYIKAFTRLRRSSTNGGAPHKPILLLSVLHWAEEGGLEDDRVRITPELVALFRSYWNALVTTQHDCLMSLPFFHMKTEGFWHLEPRSGFVDMLNMNAFTKSLVKLDAAIECARLDVPLAALMRDPAHNALLREALLTKYFPDAPRNLPTTGSSGQYELFSTLSDKILREPPAAYRAEMDALLETDSGDEVFLRGSMFKREVPRVYDHRCAISGMRISALANISMVEACHIVPFSQSHDDTIGNGMALTPTLHTAFDRGLISISSDYRVLVSDAFHEQPGEYGIRKFEGRELLLPTDRSYWPGQGNLQWHRGRWGFCGDG